MDIEKEFRENFGRDLEESVSQIVLDKGNLDCEHQRIFYIDNAFDGQAWWCDDCSRHERMDYSPGFKIKFPKNTLISTPNPEYGAEKFYAFRTDDKRFVNLLERREWMPRETNF